MYIYITQHNPLYSSTEQKQEYQINPRIESISSLAHRNAKAMLNHITRQEKEEIMMEEHLSEHPSGTGSGWSGTAH